MTLMPTRVVPASLSAAQSERVRALAADLDTAALHFVSGYLLALAEQRQAPPVAAPAATVVTVLYGSQTGNAERLARGFFERLEQAGVAARLRRADHYRVKELAAETQLIVVISTQGDGDPPDDARLFYQQLMSSRAPKLPALRYAVLGLGDSSYSKFCAVSERLDARLAELGAERLQPRLDADLDYLSVAPAWFDATKAKLASRPAGPRVVAVESPVRPAEDTPIATDAELIEHARLTVAPSDKDVRHVELALAAPIDFVPGDSLLVEPRNPPSAVATILKWGGWSADTAVRYRNVDQSLAALLSDSLEITRLSKPLLEALAVYQADGELASIARDAERRSRFVAEHQLVDCLPRLSQKPSAQALIDALAPLAPRAYSIASSPLAAADEVHLLVSHVQQSRHRFGAASHHLATRVVGDRVAVSLQRNPRFRLPPDPSRDIIMIGAGTGVAPFRAFVQHRAAVGATGRNWLLFGNPRFRTDFLYQTEWQQALESGLLKRLSLAFSRDGADKVYVQDRLREQASEWLRWLDDGAVIYVCGDAQRLAPGVHLALRDGLMQARGIDAEEAELHLAELAADDRYQRDVY
jgi:sulfite reductase (NADPH) flavoprotein alpha-component